MFNVLYEKGVEQYALAALLNQFLMRFPEMLDNRKPLRLAPRGKRGRHFVMDEYPAIACERRRVAVAEPRIVANRQRQVQVLVTVLKPLVPSAHILERLPIDQHAEPGQDADVMDLRQANAPHGPLVSDHAVGYGAARQKPAVRARRHEFLEPSAIRGEGIVVDEDRKSVV